MRYFYLILLLFCGLRYSARAQPYYFNHYQVENGLSNNTVICSLIDKKGFLWFGTKDGLNRFDGYNFKIFRREPDNPYSIGNNSIYSLFQENNGDLWVGTEGGLYLYSYGTEKFSLLRTNSTGPIRTIVKDKQENLWFIAGPGLYKLDKHRKLKSYAARFDVTALCLVGDSIWVGSPQGFIRKYNPSSNRFTAFSVVDDPEKIGNNWIEKLYSDSAGRIYIGTSSEGIKVFDTRLQKHTDLIKRTKAGADIFARDFIRRSADEIWVATESGIFIYNEKDGTYINLKKRYNDPFSLSDNAVYTFCKDYEGEIWAGTYFGGINYLPAKYTYFEKSFPKTGENSISGNAVREICKDKWGNMWIGTEDAGLNKLDTRTGKFTVYHPLDGRSNIANSNIHGLLALDNELWIGTFEHGLDVMDLRTEKVVRHYEAGSGIHQLRDNFIYCIYKTTDGTVLIGTAAGLYRYNKASDDFSKAASPLNYFYTALMEDSSGNIWAGTYRNGIYCYNFKTGKEIVLQDPNNIAAILKNNRVTGVLESSDHFIWLTTEAGMFKCDRSGRFLKHFTVKNGLPTDLLYSILEDNQKQLWISSSKGMAAFSMLTEKVKTFSKSNGLLTDQFNYNSGYKDPKGKLFFGSVKGMISFDPSQFIRDTFIPPVYITGFQVHNKELSVDQQGSPLKQSIISTKSIKLGHRYSTFSIDFSALSYTSSGSIEYAYRMEGLDQQWTYIQKNRGAYFTELPPGNYVFHVKATNSSHNWTTGVTSLAIEIVPPFWKSPIAYLCYSILTVLSVYVLTRNYKRKLEQQHQNRREKFETEKEKEIYQAKIDFFTNVAHEIRTPLTLIRAPMDKVIKRAAELPDIEKSLQTMNRNTQRLLSLTNQLLDFRSTETQGFSLNFVKADVAELLNEIWANFQPAAEHKNLSYRIVLPKKPALLAYVDTEAFTKIISNLLDNAIKYAKTEVVLKLIPAGEVEEMFQIEVSSDNKPLSPEQRERIFEPFFRRTEDMNKPGTGIGLAIARALSDLHGGSLTINEPTDGFNTFVVKLPVHHLFEFNLKGKWKKR